MRTLHAKRFNQGKQRARLTEADVISIFKIKLSCISATTICRSYGVSEKAIRDIWCGRTWAKETFHLDPSRALVLKQVGRPKGRRDSRPRQKRVLLQSITLNDSSITPLDADEETMLKPSPDFRDESKSLSIEDLKGRDLHSIAADHFETCWSKSANLRCCLLTLDEQLYGWDGVRCELRNPDPFKSDWKPVRCEF